MADVGDPSDGGSSGYSSEDEEAARHDRNGVGTSSSPPAAESKVHATGQAAPAAFAPFASNRIECASCRDDVTDSDRVTFRDCGHCVCAECACLKVLCAAVPVCPFSRCSRAVVEYSYRNAAKDRELEAKVVRPSGPVVAAPSDVWDEEDESDVWDEEDERPLSDLKAAKKAEPPRRDGPGDVVRVYADADSPAVPADAPVAARASTSADADAPVVPADAPAASRGASTAASAATAPVVAPDHNVLNRRWLERCAELRQWLRTHEDLLPGQGDRYPGMEPDLAHWVTTQKRYYSHFVEGFKGKEAREKPNRRTMTMERKKILDKLGFEDWWEYTKITCEPAAEKYAKAITAAKAGTGAPEDGAAEAKSTAKTEPAAVPAEKHAISHRDQAWETKFRQLEEHKRRNGAAHVTLAEKKQSPELKSLYYWCSTQRRHYQTLLRQANPDMPERYTSEGMSLTKYRMDKLNSIGFQWALMEDYDAAWEKRYAQLLEYKRVHGDCVVPYKYAAVPGLGYWVDGVRKTYRGKKRKTSKLTEERIRRLESIGFVWQTKVRSCFRKSDLG